MTGGARPKFRLGAKSLLAARRSGATGPSKNVTRIEFGDPRIAETAPRACCGGKWWEPSRQATWRRPAEHSSNIIRSECRSSVSETMKKRKIRAQTTAAHCRHAACLYSRGWMAQEKRHRLSKASAIATHNRLRNISI